MQKRPKELRQSIDFILWTAIKRQESSICILCTQSVPLDHLSGPYVSWSTCCMFDMQFSHILFPPFSLRKYSICFYKWLLKGREKEEGEMCSVSTELQRRRAWDSCLWIQGTVCAGCAKLFQPLIHRKKYESVILKQVEDGPPAVWTDNLFPVHWFRSGGDAVAPNMESKCTSGKGYVLRNPIEYMYQFKLVIFCICVVATLLSSQTMDRKMILCRSKRKGI